MIKPLRFVGRSHDEMTEFPLGVQSDAGYQLYLIQMGKQAEDWRPMSGIGPGVNEVRIWSDDGTFRVIYVAKFEEAVYVLRCFQKKTQKTEQLDLEIARERLRILMRDRS